MLRETVDVVLRGGGTVDVRPVAPADAEPLTAFLGAMSDQSRYLRFFGGGVDLGRAARRLAQPSEDVFVLVAERGADRRIVGVGELAVLPRGASILHARLRVAAAEPEPLWPAIGASPPRA